MLNDKEVKEFAMSDPEGESLSALLLVKPGKNTLSIETIPKENSGEIIYAYDIYEFPKESTDPELLFNEKYRLFSSTKKGEVTGFVKTTKTEKFSFEINAN